MPSPWISYADDSLKFLYSKSKKGKRSLFFGHIPRHKQVTTATFLRNMPINLWKFGLVTALLELTMRNRLTPTAKVLQLKVNQSLNTLASESLSIAGLTVSPNPIWDQLLLRFNRTMFSKLPFPFCLANNKVSFHFRY